jgi:hypothetical protein
MPQLSSSVISQPNWWNPRTLFHVDGRITGYRRKQGYLEVMKVAVPGPEWTL